MKKISALLILFFFFLFFPKIVRAECALPQPSDSPEILQKKTDDCNRDLTTITKSLKPHEEKMALLEADINAIDANIKSLASAIALKKKAIALDESRFSERLKKFDVQTRDFYKRNWTSPLEYLIVTLFSGDNVSDTVQALAYRQNLINQEKKFMTSLALEISDLASQKKKLEESQSWLAAKQKDLEVTLAPIRKLVQESKAYQSQLTQTIGALSARQQELLAEKNGNFQTSVGDVPDTQDPNSSIDGFRNNAPAGSFAGFSFGAPHRKGMSQYGAYGRSKSGQNAETILHAYYGGIEIKKDYSTSINISVQGRGSSFNIEDYVKGVCEVPNSWGDNGGFEALKAQAVAARSYALAYTNNGSGSICATESCQVYCGPKGGNWERAVNDTRGWVLVTNGQPLSAWYAASAGGYTNSYTAQGYTTPGEWDTTCGSQGCWTNDAFEKIASSPWFYKAWYKPRYSSATRSNAWLSGDEFTDIANAVFLYTKDKNNITHLSQTDKSNSDTWSRDEVRSRLGSDAFSSVSSVSVGYSTGGYTNSVTINGRTFSGEDFRTIFNIRAPGEIWLASALFNIEHK